MTPNELADELDEGRLAYEQGALTYEETTSVMRRAAQALRAQEQRIERLSVAGRALAHRLDMLDGAAPATQGACEDWQAALQPQEAKVKE